MGARHPARRQGGRRVRHAPNTGDVPDRLVSASSGIAERVELHTHIMDGDVMRMREVEGGIPLPPGET